jgi:hypothetical protein
VREASPSQIIVRFGRLVPGAIWGRWRLSKEYQRPIKSTASLKYARSRVDGLAASKG